MVFTARFAKKTKPLHCQTPRYVFAVLFTQALEGRVWIYFDVTNYAFLGRTTNHMLHLYAFVCSRLSVPLDMTVCQLTGLSRSVQFFLMSTRLKNFRKHRWAHRCFSSIVLGFGQTWGDGYTHILCWHHARAFPELSRYVIISSWLGSFQPQRLHVLMFEFGCLVSLVTPIWK